MPAVFSGFEPAPRSFGRDFAKFAIDKCNFTRQRSLRSPIECGQSGNTISGNTRGLRMKKIALFAAVAAGSLALAACGEKKEEAPVAEETAAAASDAGSDAAAADAGAATDAAAASSEAAK